MATPHEISLVKYGKAEVVQGVNDATMPNMRFLQRMAQDQQVNASSGCGNVTDPFLLELMQHACKEAALSQIDKEQILDAIVPPREWDDEGKHYRQLISKETSTRADVIALNDLLNEQLTNRQARPDGICPIRRELADQCFDELIRQVTISQAERGLLLLRVRDELRMTLSAYQDLFVSSRDYDSKKTVGKETATNTEDLSKKQRDLHEVAKDLEKERLELATAYEHEEVIFSEEREFYNKRHQDEADFLESVNAALQEQIDAMLDAENNVDPVIFAYEGVHKKEVRSTYRKNACKEKPPT